MMETIEDEIRVMMARSGISEKRARFYIEAGKGNFVSDIQPIDPSDPAYIGPMFTRNEQADANAPDADSSSASGKMERDAKRPAMAHSRP